MAVAVVPTDLIDEVRDFIEPQKERDLDESQEAFEGEWDSVLRSGASEDEWAGITDKDRESIEELLGDAGDEEDDE